jgi:RNA polymerase sigma-70 factor (ECF subfamily)
MNLESEQLLIAEVKANPEQFGRVFDEFYPRILKYCVKRTGDVALSEDITSEVFIKAFKNIQKFQWRNVTFSAWLYRIALNEISSHFRKKQHVSLDVMIQEEGFDPPDRTLLYEEIVQAEDELQKYHDFLKVQRELQNLPLKYQEVLSLRYFEEKKVGEIAEILDKKEGAVKSLLSRGFDKLLELVSAQRLEKE